LPRRLNAIIAAILLCAAAAGCAPVRYSSELTAPDGLGPGDPVINLGATIGSVAAVSPLPDGNSAVAFDVDHSDARLVMQDSIMVLHNDAGGPNLELLNPNPFSVRAPAGATIVGASNDNEANLLLASRGLAGLGTSLPAIASALGAMPPGTATGPAAATAQQQLGAIQNWYAAYGARNAAAAAQQLQQINQSAAALERELVNQGHSAQAQQLRQQIEQLGHTLTTAPPPAGYPPNPAPPPTH
jgi:ABC-type transporter Mla subunit MlaD